MVGLYFSLTVTVTYANLLLSSLLVTFIVVVPAFLATQFPFESTVITVVSPLLYVTDLSVASIGRTVVTNVPLSPTNFSSTVGLTLIDPTGTALYNPKFTFSSICSSLKLIGSLFPDPMK